MHPLLHRADLLKLWTADPSRLVLKQVQRRPVTSITTARHPDAAR
jgi:hypothetical protein